MARTPIVVLVVLILAGCQGSADPTSELPERATTSPRVVTTPSPKVSSEPDNPWVTARPAWLGKRILPLRPDGFGEVRPTPPRLRNRRLATIDFLPPPEAKGFHATITPVPKRVVTRSSWEAGCPVVLEELAYITMPFWGFDRQRHTGEMIVNALAAEDVTSVFERIYRARFPIEEMRVVTREEVESWNRTPTGDMNTTSSFECREAAQSSQWSQHAYGLAIDINPFHNPYLRGDLVAPELASAYVDRNWVRPGMILDGSEVTAAFDAIGWGWGGRWNSLKDWMHFSRDGN